MRAGFAFVLLCLAGCSSSKDTYAPPEQRKGSAAPAVLGHFLEMTDPLADRYIVQDVSPATEGQGWRWTYRRPELRFFLPAQSEMKFSMDFAIPERIFKEIAPVTIAFSVNGQPLDKVRYEKGGHLHYEKKVPAALLRKGENLVAIEPDKVWVSKADGAALGFILSRAGFVE